MAQDYPTVNTSGVKDVRVFLYEEAGSISGYVVFYNDEGKECAVDTTGGSDREAVLFSNSSRISLEITPSGFQELPLRGGGTVFGFPIPKFHVSREWRALGFTFRWDDFNKKVVVTNED